jgi:hypothetical protein
MRKGILSVNATLDGPRLPPAPREPVGTSGHARRESEQTRSTAAGGDHGLARPQPRCAPEPRISRHGARYLAAIFVGGDHIGTFVILELKRVGGPPDRLRRLASTSPIPARAARR